MQYLGLLNICKVPGLSSHEVVGRVRRLAGMKRVGHAGTLDPSACGVLPVCLGQATRLADYISAGPKSYRAEFTFGIATASSDVEGVVTARADASALREADVLAALPAFTGVIQQRPPIHSAIQIGGLRAYDLARRGELSELPAREVTVYAFTLVRFQPGSSPCLLADITVSKGTYIRSLAHDLGEHLGVHATLTFLARTQVGGCRLEDALTLEEITEAAEAGRLADIIQAPDTVVDYLPALTLPASSSHYTYGSTVSQPGEPGLYRVYLAERFLGLGRLEEGQLRPVVNFQLT